MRHYFLAAILIPLAAVFIAIIPTGTGLAENILVDMQIPQNNSQVAGIQKYNIPPVGKNLAAPVLSARAVLVKDLNTETVLLEKDSIISLPIASTTKIMTALVASEFFRPNSVITIGNAADISGAQVGFSKGETLSFRSVLYGMLLNSGNDAAFAVAENYPGGVLGFVSAMNKKAADLNLKNTRFDNPAGFDSAHHYSSAQDLAIVTQQALKDSQLSRIFATSETEVISLDKKHKHELRNLNKLLTQVVGVLGVKTGFTQAAKENLVTLVERDGHKILVVVLGSNDRFGESTAIIEWAYQNFQWSDQ